MLNIEIQSSDIIVEFRDKATNIALFPLSFEEFCNYKKIHLQTLYLNI